MNELDRFGTSDVHNSITNSSSTVYDDNDNPFTLLEWVERTNSVGSVDKLTSDYNRYVKSWRSIKNATKDDNKLTIKNVYINFLKEVVMKYTSEEEKRYIKNVDFSNPTEADAAIPFFAKRIKEIIQIIYNNRQQLKFQKVKNSLGGSIFGLQKVIFDTIVRFVRKEDLMALQYDLPDINDVVRNCRITVQETYDLGQNYHDTHFLYTEGQELLTEQGLLYTGYYNISKQSDGSVVYRTGKTQTSDSTILTRVNYRIPLKSNISYVSYGQNRSINPYDKGVAF